MATIEKIGVYGVLEAQDITFDFSVSPYFLVGPNGTGKSTALKILHYIFTGQWGGLEKLPFYAFEVFFSDGRSVVYEQPDFTRLSRLSSNLSRFTRRGVRTLGAELPSEWNLALAFLEGRHDISSRGIRRPSPGLIAALSENYEDIALLINSISSFGRGRTLYFPTYRRVERDLSELLNDDNDFDFEDDVRILPEIVDRFESFGEVVGFGGQDITSMLADVSSEIEIAARNALNEHSVRFLEVLSSNKREDTARIRKIVKSEEETSHLLDRIAAFSSLSLNKADLSQKLDQIRAKLNRKRPGRPDQQQEMLLFYLAELSALTKNIDILSGPLVRFASIVDRYLKPQKECFFRDVDNRVVLLDRLGNDVELDQLSSGEKQIIAFFAFLLLKRKNSHKIIIIDEPELSLSVSWQKTLIADIANLSPNSYIVSATHSPFIFENFGIRHAKSLGVL